MPHSKPPDMRVFDRTIACDHALFDGALVRVFQEYSNWTESVLQAPPFSIDHFRHHTQRKFAEMFRQVPNEGMGEGIARQDFSDRRILLQHLAHCFVRLWGLDVHTHRNDVQEALRCLRINLFEILKVKKLLVIFENNPLRQHHTVKYEQTSEGMQPIIRMKEDDIALARYLAGPEPHIHGSPAINQHTLDLLRSVEPFLMEIDDTHIEYQLLGVRQRLRERLAGQALMTLSLQQDLLRIISDDWEELQTTPENQEAMDVLADELHAETGVEDPLAAKPLDILHQCFGVLQQPGNIDDAMREKLLRRRPILEFLLCNTILRHKEETQEHWQLGLATLHQPIVSAIQAYHKRLELSLSELGHLGLMLATQSAEIPLEEIRERYLL